MLCCLWQDPSAVGGNDTGVSLFPGQRRSLAQPAGNGNSTPTKTAPLVVNVVVPPGMQSGQTVQVQAPDGSRTVNAIIPQGLESGQTFFVTFPPASTANNKSASSSTGNAQTVAPSPVAGPMSPAAAPIMPPVAGTNQSTTHVPFSQVLDGPPPSRNPHFSPSTTTNRNDQKLLLVNVPPGSVPGSTLYVSVPGENRTLAAKVPHGVTQFHVAYQPRAGTAAAPIPVYDSPHSVINPIPTSNDNGQKLILVRVPPGTAPGTTLHVTVPGEPGRVLAAEVPPNTSEFQVAYIPRSLQQQQQQQQQQQSYGQSHYNGQQGGGMGRMNNAMLPLLGAAALGTAGFATYDHYHHHGSAGYQDYGDYGGYHDYGDSGGYDGGDYGGGDFGGADFGGAF